MFRRVVVATLVVEVPSDVNAAKVVEGLLEHEKLHDDYMPVGSILSVSAVDVTKERWLR